MKQTHRSLLGTPGPDATSTVSAEFFEGKYRCDPDPWAFASDEYEQDRYQQILDAVRESTIIASPLEPCPGPEDLYLKSTVRRMGTPE